MEPDQGDAVVRAAGGVVWREGPDDTPQILLVHRPRYDDWSLPKGKLDPGETAPDAARREVLEETGLRCELGPELLSVGYRDRNHRPKQVRYWAMKVVGGTFEPNDEVDRIEWLDLRSARARLSYRHDIDVINSFEDRVLLSPDRR